ncbi:MAG TPA: acyltransferase [Hymenobacter sp.]|jgi:peptidoglycan/LPS O-acetylase OafA/YrhL
MKHLEKRKFEYNLEGLRGLAALIVVWFHAVSVKNLLDPHYTPSGPLAYCVPGHLSVLLFFVLSGYVIGLTNKAPLTGAAIAAYLRKRFVRIYPIYAVALLLTLFVAQSYPLTTWLAHFSLTQVLLSPVIGENAPMWSLHYEVFYYLLFIPLSMWRVDAWLAAGACFFIGLFNQLAWPANTLLTSYSYGFTFWLCGLALARSPQPSLRSTYQFLLGMMLLLLSMRNFNVYETILLKVMRLAVGERLIYPAITEQFRAVISFADLAFLPFGMVCIRVFTNQNFPGRRYVLWALFGLPAATFLYIVQHNGQVDLNPYVMSTVFYLAAVAMVSFPSARVEAWSAWVMQQFVKLGGISYALYVVHDPIAECLRRIGVFSGTGMTYSVRFALLLALSLLAAHLLENKFQPLMRRLLESRRPELHGPKIT